MHCCSLKGFVGGIDEAGRGPLAGPVVSSCVIWKSPPDNISGINDSKMLSEKKRAHLFDWIKIHAYKVGIGIADHEEIDRINIFQASLLSMKRALEDTSLMPDLLLIDGTHGLAGLPQSKPIIKGDKKCFYIACASIVAKVVRDCIMETYHGLYPQYNFSKNKGYPTKFHKDAIKEHGISPVHRKTFRGVKEYLVQ